MDTTLDRRDIYADGRFQPTTSTGTVPVVNPTTEEVLGSVPASGDQDVDTAVGAARRAFYSGPWGRATPVERADAMDRLAAALERRGDDLARLVSQEMGMPLELSRFNNMFGPVSTLRYYAGLAREFQAEETRTAVNYPGRTVLRREPVGVVGMIAPWNYPLQLAMTKLAPALAAGCTTVLKPAPETALSAYLLAEAADEADLPAGVFNLVTGLGATGELLVRHPQVDKVAFTGSTTTGRRIAAICGDKLVPVNLELGGKSAAIVLDDVDLDAMLAQLPFLTFGNSGQTCFAMTRFIAPRSRYDEVVGGLERLATSQVLGDPLDPATTMGPLVTERQRARVESYVRLGTGAGARVVTGGRRPPEPGRGYFFEPTVFADADNSMPIAREEIFGPVLTVIRYDDEAEAVAIANDSDYGLAGSVWTGDPEHGLDIARRVEAGTFGVNQYIPDLGSPWGGYKASGMGREYGPEGMAAYLKTKAVFTPLATSD
ncbi:aldehyde dehydrogenase [Planosporangium mesophilum]|uniref:Aldehyde dehydrogenase n=1 Tax=Planosporangium mesophilum TaxID=689768 RepID=A0A8J3TGF1_9ACTN|nr:aldehyde dehydrogenase [Planosporangium mesophilum]NJC85891.1 aldehyde dehydrogenase [Planosporangium mesophilum]GII25061.1 aldehyde dehydrogenase [Planosporangium mesophilum]